MPASETCSGRGGRVRDPIAGDEKPVRGSSSLRAAGFSRGTIPSLCFRAGCRESPSCTHGHGRAPARFPGSWGSPSCTHGPGKAPARFPGSCGGRCPGTAADGAALPAQAPLWSLWGRTPRGVGAGEGGRPRRGWRSQWGAPTLWAAFPGLEDVLKENFPVSPSPERGECCSSGIAVRYQELL